MGKLTHSFLLSFDLMNLSFRVSYRDGVMEHEPKACAAVKGTQIMVCALSLPLAIFFFSFEAVNA